MISSIHALHYIASYCQVLILRSTGRWSEEALKGTANFLGLLGQPGAMASVRSAADANYVGPERFKFNEKSNQPERAANAPLPMLAKTRALLLSFFNDHWDAAFEDDDDDRATDPCA